MLRARDVSRHRFGGVLAMIAGLYAFGTASFGQTKSTALPAECSAYASVPLPAEAEQDDVPKTPPNCASYRSYRGIGRPVNYSEARACAWKERLAQRADVGQNEKEPIAWVVGGSLILADIYFNGAGVRRNIPLAMHLACESEEDIVRLAAPDIAKLDGSHPAQRRFEFCDYASSTFMMNFCSAYASQIDDERRSRYFNSLKSSMTPEERTAFERLLSARDAYVEAHTSEVDQGGTIRGVRTIGSKAILKDLFQTDVVNFEHKKWPALSDKEIALAETWLHREYEKKIQELRTHTKDEIDEGAVTAERLAGVERTWQTYRDAWVAFARVRYPSAVDVICSKVTLERYRLLKTVG
jgi:hypothetical protein